MVIGSIIAVLVLTLGLLFLLIRSFPLFSFTKSLIIFSIIALIAVFLTFWSYTFSMAKEKEKLALNSFLSGQGVIFDGELLDNKSYSISIKSPYMLIPKNKNRGERSIFLRDCQPNTTIDIEKFKEITKD